MRPPICDKTAPPHLENPGSATDSFLLPRVFHRTICSVVCRVKIWADKKIPHPHPPQLNPYFLRDHLHLQESIPVGSIPPASVATTRCQHLRCTFLGVFLLGAYVPGECSWHTNQPTPRRDLGPGIPTYPRGQNDIQTPVKALPSLAGGKNR